MTARIAALVAAVAAGVTACASAPVGLDTGGPDLELELLGVTTLAGDLTAGGWVIGGLSSVAWEPTCNHWLALSDDPALVGPPRVIRLAVDLGDGRLDDGDVRVIEAVPLRRPDGERFGEFEVDPESIAVDGGGRMWIGSEGHVTQGVAGWVRQFALDGTYLAALEMPRSVLGAQRHNLGLEGLSLTPDGRYLWGGIENALETDGPMSDLGVSSPVRLVRWDLVAGGPPREFLYRVEPTPDEPTEEGAYRVNGLSELLALDEATVVVLERSFAVGVGNRAKLYLATIDGEAEVTGELGAPPDHPTVPKRMLADLETLGLDPDNLEGIDVGPVLPDGRRVLVLVSDNNFQPEVQATQVVAFAIRGVPAPAQAGPSEASVPRIQGSGWLSPSVGQCVTGVAGVVTAVAAGRREGPRVWIQDPAGDGDPSTSDALRLDLPRDAVPPSAGTAVVASGRVVERGWGLDLPVTALEVTAMETQASGRPLPDPVRIDTVGLGAGVLGGAFGSPGDGLLAAYEALESMRVEVGPATVVGPTRSYGQLAVVPDTVGGAGPRTLRGIPLKQPAGVSAGQVLIDDNVIGDAPTAAVGARFSGPVTGVLDLGFGAWHVNVTGSWPLLVPGAIEPETTTLAPAADRLRIATFNVENLSAVSSSDKIAKVAEIIAGRLRGPAIVALQEIQDDTGPEDDGTESAAGTLTRLTEAIVVAGGPRYDWRQVDPEDGQDGGQPGGNIRNVVLFDPTTVRAVDRGDGRSGARVVDGPRLSASPARLFADHAAFGGDPLGREKGTRKPLAVELEVAGQPLFIVDLHLSSKWGDDPLFGRRQPPLEPTAAMRLAQARRVREFAEAILDRDPGASVVVLGDLNDAEWSDPVTTLAGDPLLNLIELLPPEERYTYVHRGTAQAIDHILVSPALAAVAELDIVHVSSEFPDGERASDHDPVLASFDLSRLP
jgi:endonuclease/exonuclease/phosphatase family metal-dependent hydrolase